MSAGRFAGQVALVTGGGSGIGRAACRLLAGEGARVLVADRDGTRAGETAALIAADGGEAEAHRADIASEADNAAMFDAAEARFGGIDHAFLNAGMLQPFGPFAELTTETFDRLIGVNLRGTFFGLKQAQARLRAGGACVVTASAAGLIGLSEAAAYAASKHGVLGLVRSAARAFADRGLRVNALCPGNVLTPMNGVAQDDALAGTLADPAYRGGLTGQHVAAVALFLLSRQAAAINGHAQVADAGFAAAFPPFDC